MLDATEMLGSLPNLGCCCGRSRSGQVSAYSDVRGASSASEVIHESMVVTAELPRVKWELSHALLTAVKLDFGTVP